MNKRFSDSPRHQNQPPPVAQFIMLLALPSANNKQQMHSHAHTIVEKWAAGAAKKVWHWRRASEGGKPAKLAKQTLGCSLLAI